MSLRHAKFANFFLQLDKKILRYFVYISAKVSFACRRRGLTTMQVLHNSSSPKVHTGMYTYDVKRIFAMRTDGKLGCPKRLEQTVRHTCDLVDRFACRRVNLAIRWRDRPISRTQTVYVPDSTIEVAWLRKASAALSASSIFAFQACTFIP